MTMTVCRECSADISDQAAACPHCGAPLKAAPASVGLACNTCKLALLPITTTNVNGFVGVIITIVAVIGLIAFLFNWLAGLIVLAFALLLMIAGRTSATRMRCPKCGYYAPAKL